MKDNTDSERFLEAVIRGTVMSLPGELLSCYRNPPGRNPAVFLRRLSALANSNDHEEILMLVSDVVDATVFAMLYMIEDCFEGNLDLALINRESREEICLEGLVERYRQAVSPGGFVDDTILSPE